MRIQLHFSPNYQPVPFNHLHYLTGALHKWLGPNENHDDLSLYSFGWLQKGEKIGKGLMFPQGATLNLSFHESEKAWEVARGILEDPAWRYGMRVTKALEQPYPAFATKARFMTDRGGIILRYKKEDGKRDYMDWTNPNSSEALTRILRRKMEKAGFLSEDLKATMEFDKTYRNPYTKKITIKKAEHICSVCPVIVTGTPKAVRFAWLTGAGELTGSGFGALK